MSILFSVPAVMLIWREAGARCSRGRYDRSETYSPLAMLRTIVRAYAGTLAEPPSCAFPTVPCPCGAFSNAGLFTSPVTCPLTEAADSSAGISPLDNASTLNRSISRSAPCSAALAILLCAELRLSVCDVTLPFSSGTSWSAARASTAAVFRAAPETGSTLPLTPDCGLPDR